MRHRQELNDSVGGDSLRHSWRCAAWQGTHGLTPAMANPAETEQVGSDAGDRIVGIQQADFTGGDRIVGIQQADSTGDDRIVGSMKPAESDSGDSLRHSWCCAASFAGIEQADSDSGDRIPGTEPTQQPDSRSGDSLRHSWRCAASPA